MAITSQDMQMILQAVSQMIREQKIPVAEHGVATQSWAPIDVPPQVFAGTVEVTVGKTAAIIGDDGDQYVPKPRVHVATTHVGDQYGPVGGERVVLIPTETGPIALFIHGSDDSPQAPAGERWIQHRDPVTGVVNSYTKYQNNVAIVHSAQAVGAPGPVQTIVDGSGVAISHVVPTGGAVALGALASSLGPTNALINQSHLSTFEGALLTKRLDDLTKFATAMVSAGVPNAGTVIGLLASLLHVPVPAGSAKVFSTS